MEQKLSAATKRAIAGNYYRSSDWFCDFSESKLTGCFEQEEGVHRRDPSSVILVGDTYYTYYSKSYGKHVGFRTGDLDAKVFPWDYTEIWYATSKDGYHWIEGDVVVKRGAAGCYDDRSVFTPEIMKYAGDYYLVYQTVQHPYMERSFENIAIAKANAPEGPFEKSKEPILRPMMDGEWDGDIDDRFFVKKKGSFDSHKVHDPLLFHFNNKFYLYYKGNPMGERAFMGGRDTKWGVAIADHIMGPYIRSEYNPVTNSGHETCLWKTKNGMAAFLRTDGVEKNTLQFAEDGINFEIMSVIKGGPEACGPFRHDDAVEEPLDGMKWGLSHQVFKGWNYIIRFDISTKARDNFRRNDHLADQFYNL